MKKLGIKLYNEWKILKDFEFIKEFTIINLKFCINQLADYDGDVLKTEYLLEFIFFNFCINIFYRR